MGTGERRHHFNRVRATIYIGEHYRLDGNTRLAVYAAKYADIEIGCLDTRRVLYELDVQIDLVERRGERRLEFVRHSCALIWRWIMSRENPSANCNPGRENRITWTESIKDRIARQQGGCNKAC